MAVLAGDGQGAGEEKAAKNIGTYIYSGTLRLQQIKLYFVRLPKMIRVSAYLNGSACSK